MRYFITENGSVLKLDETLEEFFILRNALWARLVSCKPPIPPRDDIIDALMPPPLPPFRDDEVNIKKYIVDNHGIIDLQAVELPIVTIQHGALITTENIRIQFVDVRAIVNHNDPWPVSLETPAELKSLWDNQCLRARLAKSTRELIHANTMGSNAKVSGRDLAKRHVTTSTIYNYDTLKKFAENEMLRLRRPLTFNGRTKAKKIEDALKATEASEANWLGQKALREKSYAQFAHDSGLIEALQWHRFAWSSKAKNKRATSCIEKLEAASPGITKIV
jgi:hypothetical protein